LPGWNAHYSNWLRAERNRAINSWCPPDSSQHASGSHPEREQLRGRYVYQLNSHPSPPVPLLWHTAATALTLRHFAASGLDASYATCDGSPLM
jgi:hypothetical protein